MSMLGSIGQTMVIPAQPGFELLSLKCAGEVMRHPNIGWAELNSSQLIPHA